MTIPVFYHIACINHWREILVEQLTWLGYVQNNVLPIELHLSISNTDGSPQAHSFVAAVCKAAKIPYMVDVTTRDHFSCETPAILALERFARHPQRHGPLFYLHAKGVAHPDSEYRTLWRWYMNFYSFNDFATNIELLSETSWVAPKISTVPFPHSAGNYFFTTCEFIKTLPDFTTFRREFGLAPPCNMQLRHADEMWLGSTNVAGTELTPVPSDRPYDPTWWRNHPDQRNFFITNGY